MEEVQLSPASRNHPWKDATLRRMAWAQSRESWQPPDCEVPLSTPSPQDKSDSASQNGSSPNEITSWLWNCRTPLGASLDEQSSSPTKGPQRNGCSFEDDLSLGAEANLLQNGTAKPVPSCELLATEKRSQFRQMGRSMNSTGSGKSSGTVSSVSELLDRYEEDPEQILYNLGFGRDEPDIASKIPSRFFNWSSSAKGIDIKVYLEAQMQRMELENPNYALTSRFRQTEVLATVANVFSEIYSHVSGRPVEPICQVEPQSSEPAPLKRNNSALNAAKILKRNLTRPNLLLNSTEGSQTNNSKSSETESHSDSEGKHIKFASCLATVTEEALQGGGDTSNSTEKINSERINGQQSSSAIVGVVLDVTDNPVLVNGTSISHSDSVWSPERSKISSSSHSDKEHFPFLPNPHMTHLLSQTKDSFEMEELQSNEDEALPMNHSFSRNEGYSRTASQQSDSSGFAEDPLTDGPANFLKVQESSDSCDSETTVTSHSGEATSRSSENSAFGEKLLVPPTVGFLKAQQEVPSSTDERGSSQCVMDQTRPETLPDVGSEMQVTTRSSGSVLETSSSTESASTVESTATASARDPEPSTSLRTAEQQDLTNGRLPDDLAESDLATSPRTLESEPKSGSLTESKPCIQDHSTTRGSNQRSSSFEDRRGRVWVQTRELLQDTDNRVKSPFIRSSSLPTTLLSPSRVVSSIRIQLNQGSVRHCTPPCYSYRYEDEQDVDGAIAEEDEYKAPTASKPNRALKNSKGDSFSLNPETDLDDAGYPPYPLNMSQNLTRSASSLYSTPSDWPMRRLAEGPAWSTSSVPDLTPYTGISHPAIPRHIQQELNSFRGGVNSPYQKSPNSPSRSGTPLNNAFPYTHSGMYPQYLPSQNSPFPHPPYTPPHHPPYTHPQSIPYHPSPPFHSPSPSPHYGSTFNLHASPYSPQGHLTHSYSAPYSLAYNNAPYHPHMPYGHQYNSQYHLPPSEFASPCDGMTPSPSMSSTEMQLRRVLHEIRGTVQSLGQTAPESRNETPSGAHGSHRAAQPLYEELQRRRQNLNLFRSQMMDLELTLIRQQSMVYQLLSPDERHEAEQLQRLRVAVRQELQELELQLEGRIEALDDQLHSGRNSQLYRHPLDMSRGYSMDSLSSSSALKATEPVSDLLREQMCLQSELSYDGSVGALDTPTSARSSRSASPTRSRDREDLSSLHLQRGRKGVFSSSVSLTPSIPSRRGIESQERTITSRAAEVSNQRPAEPVSAQGDVNSTKGEDPQHQGDRQKEESGGNAYLQQVIQQIKQSLAHEIRQEIVTELLAAVSPQRSPVVTQDSAP